MKRIIITESQYRHILNNRHLLSEQEKETTFETFDFSGTYYPNIAFPIKPNVKISSTKDVLNPANLNNSLVDFINKLKLKIKNGVKVGMIRINTGASSDKATTNVPDGFTQDVVNYSLKSDKGNQKGNAFGAAISMLVTNANLEKNRGENMKVILTELIPELKSTKIEIKTGLGEKAVKIQIPSTVMVNFKTHPEISKDYVEPKTTYTPSFDKPSVVATCNKQSEATGSAGKSPNYIADRIKLDVPENYSGNISFKYNSFVVPDRFKLLQVKDGKETALQDTGFVTSTDDNNTFNIFKRELESYGGGQLKQGGEGTITFNAEAGSQYFIDVIAPFGGTRWVAQIGCSKSEEKPKEETVDWASKPKIFIDGENVSKTKPEKMSYKTRIIVGDFEVRDKGNVKNYKGYMSKIFLKDGYVLECESSCKTFARLKYENGVKGSKTGSHQISSNKSGKLSYYGLA
jgi:hypothetical protein